MIDLVDISKSYPTKGGRKTILERTSHCFEKGRNTGIVGPNGAGKSTLMRLLSGAELPDGGRIDRTASVSWPLGFSGGLHGSLTGRENVGFVSRIYGHDFRETFEFVRQFADIGRNIDDNVKTYSSGMRARVAFGLSMAIQFDFYLIDEVIAVGDIAFQRKCKETLDNRLADSTVILVSHSPTMMKEFCEVGCVLHERKLFSFDNVDDAIKFHESKM